MYLINSLNNTSTKRDPVAVLASYFYDSTRCR